MRRSFSVIRLMKRCRRCLPALAVLLVALFTGLAAGSEADVRSVAGGEAGSPQTRPHDHSRTIEEAQSGSARATALLMQLASGTSLNPATAPMHGGHLSAGDWTLMMHATAFITEIQQTGPRGADQVASANWFMLSATRGAGKGGLMLRSMLSLDPATVRQGFYPLLFQTGEVNDGEPIVDGQHPHDFYMELAFAYARPFGTKSSLLLYAAPIGDPALGPAAFPHRDSNAENPTAVLGHHLQDSTHIASDVLTAGWDTGAFRFEGSGFHGAEPDEKRWNIDQGAIDSWSGRVSYRPTENWVAQVSRGKLEDPEEHEPGDVTRTTASILTHIDLSKGRLAAGLIWGRNRLEDGLVLDSYLVEGSWNFKQKNHLFGRFERVDRNELFADDPAQEATFEAAGIRFFTVAASTLGLTRDFTSFPGFQTGIGADATFHRIPSELEPFYGRSPKAYHAFLRIRWHGPRVPSAAPEHTGHH